MSVTGELAAQDRGGGPWWWERRRGFALDVFLALVSGLECAVEGGVFADSTGTPPALDVLLGLCVGVTLILRRRWPIAVVLVSLAVTPAQMGFLLTVIGFYTLAASEVPRRLTAVLAGMSAAGTVLVSFVQMNQDLRHGGGDAPLVVVVVTSFLMAIGLVAPPVLLGLYVGARRRLVESLRDRADGLERELSLLAEKAAERAEWARTEERARIAREMHDVVAHRVSLMVVHAAALKAVALRDPEKASASAELLGDMGRQALNELRQMLGVLRADGGGAARTLAFTEVGRVVAAPEAPAPRLSELAGLVEESRVVGMSVELLVEGEERLCGPRVESTVYRVVQEALTNVHKHASGAETQVRLVYRTGEVAVLVHNGPPAEDDGVRLPSGGNGLLGMKERVTALGGGFAAGPTGAGGFRVSAMLPDR